MTQSSRQLQGKILSILDFLWQRKRGTSVPQSSPLQGCQPLKYFFRIFWKNFRILINFSVSLNLFLARLKTFIMATSYLLWWDPSTPSGNSSGFFRYYRNRKLARTHATTTCGREKIECFWWLKRYLKVLRHKMPQNLTELLPKTGKLCSGSSTLSDRTDRAQFPYFVGQIRTPVFCM